VIHRITARRLYRCWCLQYILTDIQFLTTILTAGRGPPNSTPGFLFRRPRVQISAWRPVKADSHLTTRHDADTTRQRHDRKILLPLLSMGLFTVNDKDTTATRHHHDDNRQTLKESRAVRTCAVAVWTGGPTQRSQLLFFSSLKADHDSLIMNTE
jgi:hypothetical protein